MRAHKIGIVIEKTSPDRFTIQVVGLDSTGKVVASVSELEKRNVAATSIERVFDLLVVTIKRRLNRGQLEFMTKDEEQE